MKDAYLKNISEKVFQKKQLQEHRTLELIVYNPIHPNSFDNNKYFLLVIVILVEK